LVSSFKGALIENPGAEAGENDSFHMCLPIIPLKVSQLIFGAGLEEKSLAKRIEIFDSYPERGFMEGLPGPGPGRKLVHIFLKSGRP
jgi:hypothetical protein